MVRVRLKNTRGQTSLEYLMLMTVAFVATYVIVTGPLATQARYILVTIRSGIQNTVRNGEWKEGDVVGPGEAGHPGDPDRLRPVHF